jgi:S1-C subfamily serine protease
MKIKSIALVLLTAFASVEAAAQSASPTQTEQSPPKPKFDPNQPYESVTTAGQPAPTKPTWHEDTQMFTCPTGFKVYVDAKKSVPSVSCVAIKATPGPAAATIDLSAGLVPKKALTKTAQTTDDDIDLSAGLVPKPAPTAQPASLSASPRKDIPTIAKAAKGAIVTIVMAANDKPIAQGTGFLVRPDGLIVTNYHVIETGDAAVVKFSDGTVLSVDGVLAADKVRDLAIIKIHGKTFRTLTLGNSDKMQIGEEVVAIGNPLGLELTVSNGILSGVRIDKKAGGKFLQVTAPITHGSSGGPLFNMMGEVIGITTLGFEGAGDLNFAIPVNDAKRLLSNQSAKFQNLPNEKEPPKESEATPVAPASSTNPIDSPAYRQFQELFNAGDLTMMTGLYACFYDGSSQQNTTFFVIMAYLSEHHMTAQVNHFEDGVKKWDPWIFGGDVRPLSSSQGVWADLLTSYDYKNDPSKSHQTDVLKWNAGDVVIETGFGKLPPGEVRLTYQFKLQHSTGRFVADTVFNGGAKPDGFTNHETGKCIRIPNITRTPEEQYGPGGN